MDKEQTKNWLKKNWFKLIISLFLIVLLVLSVLFYGKYEKSNEVIMPQNIANETSQLDKEKIPENKIDTKLDSYIVTYDENGNPLDWTTIDRALVILDDTLSTYKTSLPQIVSVQDKERQTLDSAYGVLAKITDPNQKNEVQTLINYEEAYITSGEKFIGLLNDFIKNYENLQKVTTKRDPQLYLYYESEIKKLEAKKNGIVKDYTAKQATKQDYAKSILK